MECWGLLNSPRSGVAAIVISAALDAEKGRVAERRVRTTLAHEAGHGLLHAYLFALDEKPLHLFDADSHSDHQILCRDVQGEERKGRAYDGRWWEFQANRAMGGLLCPRALVQEALKPFLMPSGSLGGVTLDENRREGAVRALADIFDVNPIVAKIRINELYPAETGQTAAVAFFLLTVYAVSAYIATHPAAGRRHLVIGRRQRFRRSSWNLRTRSSIIS